MYLSIIEKFKIIFAYIFSSFLSIELFILSLLFLFVLIFNLKKKSQIVQIVSVGIYIGFLLGIMISYSSYAKACLDAFIKAIMNYIYFPSTIMYFFIILFVTVLMLYTIFSKKLTVVKKVINYFLFSFLYLLFMLFIILASYANVDLINVVDLYKNETILSIVQVSNLLLVCWLIFTFFYRLLLYFKTKYD